MNCLNPKLFNRDRTMKDNVRDRLLEISDEFLSQIDENVPINILDIRLVGSNAAYNYTDTSDIDLHLVVDLSEICKDHPEIVQCLFNSEKSRFNLNYDITIKGIQVEIYVEDVRAGTMSNGIYSIMRDAWIKEPEIVEDISIDEDNPEYVEMLERVEDIVYGDSSALEVLDIIDTLYLMRKSSLESEGESGTGNLIFKKIRSLGLLDELKEKYYELKSKDLTLEGVINFE